MCQQLLLLCTRPFSTATLLGKLSSIETKAFSLLASLLRIQLAQTVLVVDG
jgi:hypothetical protein